MDYLIKKTNIGIACEEAIRQMGIQQYRDTIMGHLQLAFQATFNHFKGKLPDSSGNATLVGHCVTINQYYIGKNQNQQYFRSTAFETKLNNVPLKTLGNQMEQEPSLTFTSMEGYAIKQVKKQHSKTYSKGKEINGQINGKKKVKEE